jgi:hypothetical protein
MFEEGRRSLAEKFDCSRVAYTPTPFPCPRSSLSLAIRSFVFFRSTPTGLVPVLGDHMSVLQVSDCNRVVWTPTPFPCPHSSLSLTIRSFVFLYIPTPTDLVSDFARPYGCTVPDITVPCPHSSLSLALRSLVFSTDQPPQVSFLVLRDHMP